MSIQMSANVDVECRQSSLQMSMEMSKIYRFIMEKKPKKTRISCWKNAESYVDIYIYIYIYIYTHTHTHTQKLSFEAFSRLKVQKLGTKSKKCQCRLKRPANVENMSMSMVPPNVDLIWSTSVWTLNSLSCWTTPWEKDFIHSNCQGRSARLRLF